MKASRERKTRLCKICKRTVWGDAAAMREHAGYHNLASRMAKSGLVLAQPRVVTLEEAQNEEAEKRSRG